MLDNATYDLLETTAILSKGLHRYETFHQDSRSCAECQQIWDYMKRSDEEQLRRVVSHLKDHFAKIGDIEMPGR